MLRPNAEGLILCGMTVFTCLCLSWISVTFVQCQFCYLFVRVCLFPLFCHASSVSMLSSGLRYLALLDARPASLPTARIADIIIMLLLS